MRLFQNLARFAVVASVAFAVLPRNANAQQTTVSFDSGSQFLYSSATETTANLLKAGVATTTGDGDVIRLGYYSTATAGNYFSGTFIPLTGLGSANTAYNYTSVGDMYTNGAGNGQFALILSFAAGSATTGNNLPAAGTPLAIQFYNGTTLTSSTFYNAVSDSAWTWQTPAIPGPTVTISLDQTGLQWLGGASSAFYTSQATTVPEPSSLLVGGLCLGGFVILRLRRSVARA